MAQELISLGILFFCALIGGLIASRFKQPAVFGLLLVGAIIGPNSLNLVQDASMINMMAEFGAILILFLVGLEFDITKLIKLGARSIVIGLLKVATVLFFGYQATLLMGFDMKTALFVGVILSFSSTVVVVKVLEQKAMFSRKEVPLLVAILIIEDILAVLALTFFSGLENPKGGLLDTFEHIIFAIGILVLAYFIVMKILKYFVTFIGKESGDESVITFLALGLGALFSYFALELGLTPTAGAFLAGSIIASLPNAKDYGKVIHPYVMIFTSVFFISMGTLVEFGAIQQNVLLILVLLITVIIADFVSVGVLTTMLANFKGEEPIFASMALFAVGEFSLLVAKEAKGFGVAIDLVSVTASLIFLSAIIMALGINHTHRMHSMNSIFSIKSRLKTERIANYMRKFFDQMEIENYFTTKLKNESKLALILSFIAIFAFFVAGKVISAINPQGVFRYVLYVLSAGMMIFLAKISFNRFREAHRTLAVILTHVDPSRNVGKCTKIVNSMLISLLLVLFATTFPFVIFVLNAGPLLNVVPFVLVAMAFYFIKSTINMIDGNSTTYAPAFKPGIAFAKF